MASAQDIRRRIKSVTNTQQITKAMKMVASARLRRAQGKAHATEPYAAKLGELLKNVASSAQKVNHPLLTKRPVTKTGYLIIGADKGLAGPYTYNLMKKVMTLLAGKDPETYELVVVGRKPQEYLKHRKYKIAQVYSGFSDKPEYENATELAKDVADYFVEAKVDEVVMVYTHFINSITQEVRTTKLLPVETPQVETDLFEDEEAVEKYIFVPSGEDIFFELLPKYVEISVYNSLLQAAASELGSRMTAMTSATDNASELLDKLHLEYNKVRQAGITNEISEIVGGAAAVS